MKLPTITLQMEAKSLEEVTITSKISFIERKIDRTIINVESQISNAGSNALEVLEKSPGVTVSESGIRLKGKSGVQNFIADKSSTIFFTRASAVASSITFV